MPYSPDLDRLLTEGARYRDERDEYVIETRAAGEVRLPTGQVVACDPLTGAHDALPFTMTAPIGSYPLYAWVAVLYRDGVEHRRRVAALLPVGGLRLVAERPRVIVYEIINLMKNLIIISGTMGVGKTALL